MKKVDVKGADAHPIFEYLKSQAPNEEYKGIKAKATHTMLKGISKSAKKEGGHPLELHEIPCLEVRQRNKAFRPYHRA